MITLRIVDFCEVDAKHINEELKQHIKVFKEKNPQHAEANIEIIESSYSKDDDSCTVHLNISSNPQLLFDFGLWIGDSYDNDIISEFMEDDDWDDEDEEEEIAGIIW